MARNMSFMLTTEQIKNKTKTVTRRNGWKFLKVGEILNAVEKCQGLKKGEKIKHICQIIVIDKSYEELSSITKMELVREGFPNIWTDEFIKMFCKTHKGISKNSIVTRIEFEYI
jgi:hypothetical protein